MKSNQVSSSKASMRVCYHSRRIIIYACIEVGEMRFE